MKKYQLTKIGDFHENHCEDYSLISEIGEHRDLISVLDGCTMGEESYFASALIGKLLKKIAKEEYYLEYIKGEAPSLKHQLEKVLARLFEELNDLKNSLQLEVEELLSTVILGIIDSGTKCCELQIIGDGLIVQNGFSIEYDQENTPDYIGYHLGENFEYWLTNQTQKLSLDKVSDLSISTDGIFTFSSYNKEEYSEIGADELIEYLLIDQVDIENERMLIKKLREIEKKWGLRPTDDLGIVRVIL